MPANKNAYIRYRNLDECFRDWNRKYTWEKLQDAVNAELERHSYTPISISTLRVDVKFMLSKKIEARPTWKPMHCQPVYRHGEVHVSRFKVNGEDAICQTCDNSVAYTKGVEEELFKVGFCLPAGPYVTDEDVRYIVESIKEAIVK